MQWQWLCRFVYKFLLKSISVFATIHEYLVFITSKYKCCIILGDINIDHLKIDSLSFMFFKSYVTEPFAFE